MGSNPVTPTTRKRLETLIAVSSLFPLNGHLVHHGNNPNAPLRISVSESIYPKSKKARLPHSLAFLLLVYSIFP